MDFPNKRQGSSFIIANVATFTVHRSAPTAIVFFFFFTHKITDGAHRLDDGASLAAAGSGELSDGAAAVENEASNLADGAASAADGAGTLEAGAVSAAAGSSKVAPGATQVSDGVDKIQAAIEDKLHPAAVQVSGGVARIPPDGFHHPARGDRRRLIRAEHEGAAAHAVQEIARCAGQTRRKHPALRVISRQPCEPCRRQAAMA